MYYRILLIITVLSATFACQAPQINTSPSQASVQAQSLAPNRLPVAYAAIKARREEDLKQKVLNKKTTAKAYTLTLDSTWQSLQGNDHLLTLTQATEDFKTQSNGSETVVYEETLKLESPSLSVEKEIT